MRVTTIHFSWSTTHAKCNNTNDELATLHSIATEQQDLSMKRDDYLMREN